MSEIEVLAEPVVGHRLWRWIPGEGLRGMRELWKSGFMEASCESGHESPHWAPESWNQWMLAGGRLMQTTAFGQEPLPTPCLCGVNAYKLTHPFDGEDLVWARGDSSSFFFGGDAHIEALSVWGRVELGGEVHEYEKGYRAQYAMLVEGTVLTDLPVDPKALGELEEKYEAPFTVKSYEAWRTEWEATYGRDRETEETNQGPGPFQTGGAIPTGTITISGTFGSGTSWTVAPEERTRRNRWTGRREFRLWDDWWDWFDVFMVTLISLGGLILVAGLLVMLLSWTDQLGWTSLWESTGTKTVIENTYALTWPFD